MSISVRRLIYGGGRKRRLLQIVIFCAISTYLLQDAIFRKFNYMTYGVPAQRELIQVQVIFRHGHRSPFSIYSTDPNPAEFWKSGLGKLTQLGKLQHYIIGEYLRNMYAGFVTSNPQEVHCLSSHKDRCTYGAYALLAGMYPPAPERLIDGRLLWQPIPIESPKDIFALTKNCTQLEKDQAAMMLSGAEDLHAASKDLYEFWANKSGEHMLTYISAGNLFKTLLVEKTYNLTIPDWAQETWEELRKQADICYYYNFRTRILQALRIGGYFRLMREKWRQKIENFEHPKKVHLYSSHGSDIASIQLSMHIFNMISPPYCAFISFELYREPGHRHSIRILYSNSSNPEVEVFPPHALILPGCTEYCPVEYVEDTIRDLIEEDWEKDCDDIIG